MKKYLYFTIYILSLIFISCGSINDQNIEVENNAPTIDGKKIVKILALGDSYTIGESVCTSCKFPEQLKDSLQKKVKVETTFNLKIIAQTGWTTSNLINSINKENISNNYNLVTLLIGVNNQYQNKDFSIYESEFPALVNTAIRAVKGIKNKLIVVSIPDYAFTPFGNGNTTISTGIDKYNLFAESYCKQNNITYVNITDITRQGLNNKDLVARDGLHPSELAYTKFVERILPVALSKLTN